MKTLLIAVTNRSSYAKVKTIIKNLPKHVEPILMLGGSMHLYKYGDAKGHIIYDFPGIRVFKVAMAVEGDDLSKMVKSVGLGAIEIATILDFLKPDMVLTVADRFETLATATAASYMNIPLIHLQGGETSGTIDDKVRNSITQLADFHFPATKGAKYRIEEMLGYRGDIWDYGCPSMDLMAGHDSTDALRLAIVMANQHGTGDKIDLQSAFIIIMIHSDTKFPISKLDIDNVMNVLNRYDMQKIIFWPNLDPGSEVISKEFRFTQAKFWNGRVRYIKHVDPETFGTLLTHAHCIVGNSSAGIREATFLGVPSITLGDRQLGRERGPLVVHSSFDVDKFEVVFANQVSNTCNIPSPLYGDGYAGEKIAKQIGIIAEEL